jgi:dolichyl-diphosphooligosaccharide--protein glycosyltransferase
MLYIAKKTDLGFAVGNDKYKQTLIYKMFASAPFYIREAGSVFPPVASGVDLQRLLSANVTRVLLFGEVTEPFDLGPLKPRLVIVAPYLDSSLKPVTFPSGGSTYYFAMLIAVYEWSEAS